MVSVAFSTGVPGAEVADVRATERKLSRAQRRHEQLPVPHRDAMVLAAAARSVGARSEEETFLARAIDSPIFGEVARIQLAEMVVDRDPEKAAELVLPSLEEAGSRQLREAAVEVVRRSVVNGLSSDYFPSINAASRRLPRSSRRVIEAVVADPRSEDGRRALRRLLERSLGDLPALHAARVLEELESLSAKEQWLVAACLFRHALYEEAARALEAVTEVNSKEIPVSEAAFLRGRCAFRLDRWSEAESWYRKALKVAPNATRKAEIQVHIARSLELAGNLEAAGEMARRGVLTKTSDDRRLFLIRLRLRQGRRDLASAGLARVRSTGARTRGQMLMALDDLAKGRTKEALQTLQAIKARPWRGPAGVVAASELVRAGRPDEAIDSLERIAGDLNEYWGGQARTVMASLPPEVAREWRIRQKQMAGAEGSGALRAMKRWAVLEFESEELEGIRARLSNIRPIPSLQDDPLVEGLAGDLRSIGQAREAVRWDPGSFPTEPPEEGLWSVNQFLVGESPWRAIRAAHSVWMRWGSDIPLRAGPEALEQGYYPLPMPDEVVRAAERGGVDWTIVAGVAREESRWNPAVLSRVGARGLMQLMPLTAATVATRQGEAVPTADELFKPERSLALGALELGRLTRSFNGFSAAAVAAYNAGEAQSRLWVEQCGADCSEARFVLAITFDATRGYTEDVMASAEAYRVLTERSE